MVPCAWPALLDPRATGCDAAARCALVDALATLRTPWSEDVLRRALAEEPHPAVRAAILAVLSDEGYAPGLA